MTRFEHAAKVGKAGTGRSPESASVTNNHCLHPRNPIREDYTSSDYGQYRRSRTKLQAPRIVAARRGVQPKISEHRAEKEQNGSRPEAGLE